MENALWHFYINPFITCLYEKFNHSRTPLFRTRLIRSPLYFEGRSNSLGFTLMFSVIYYQLFWTRLFQIPRYFEGRANSLRFTLMFSVIYYQLFRTRLFRIPRYFELIVLSLHLKSTPLFRTCQKQSTYIRAQLETYCILIWARTEHSKIFQCNSICWFIRHIITVFLFNQCLSSYCTVFY